MAQIIVVGDLPADIQSNELVTMMLAGANAKAARVAPCLVDTDPAPTADQLAEAKLVLVGAVKRWADAGSGAMQAMTAGPFGATVDTRQRGGFNLWPSEITQLQDICQNDDEPSGAFDINTVSIVGGEHSYICALYFGADYCSCGAILTGGLYPLYEY